jgi:hypothetical protein
MRVREGEVATGGIGTGFRPASLAMLDDARRSEKRIEQEEEERVLQEAIQHAEFERKLAAERHAARRRDFEKKLQTSRQALEPWREDL